VKEIYIDRGVTQSRIAVFEDGKITDLHIENHGDNSITGNIYKGRIENVVPGLNAAFINIGTNKNAILHFDDLTNWKELKRGQDIMVQVMREPVKDKGARVSTRISIPGKYVVLLPGTDYLGVSHKIDNDEIKEQLTQLANSILEEGFGFIIRTEAVNATEEDITEEYTYLKSIWQDIQSHVSYVRSPQILFNARDFYSFVLREYLKVDVKRVFVNRYKDFEHLKNMLKKINPKLSENVFYSNDINMANRIEREIANSIENKVPLRCGGYLIIDQAEAFVIIDVNTGSFITNENHEETILKTNLEACKEIFDIVKFRNLSGIILIDFIDMKKEEDKELVLQTIKEYFKKDKVSNRIYGFTNLGILEMSRAKKGKRLSELIYKNESPKILDSSYCLKKIENTCVRMMNQYNKKSFNIYIAPYIMEDIEGSYPFFKSEIKDIYDININFITSKYINSYYVDDGKHDFSLIKIDMGDKILSGKLIEFSEDVMGEIKVKIKRV
jgi:ribonuclease G